YHLPLAIHMREATDDTYQLLKEKKDPSLPGVMHCYSGSVESARLFLSLNLKISLAGPVTFKNARIPKAVASEIDLADLLIETDAPYLAPTPYRGKPNQPEYLPLIAAEIASIKGVSVEEVAKTTWENAHSVFQIHTIIY
ncbi:MAG: TatD family hydrolase, partial [Candidatus Izemoplasmatales bacterium]|nr:TatD family hydrolase [Candidatus Izemoplasmatales bacterium]